MSKRQRSRGKGPGGPGSGPQQRPAGGPGDKPHGQPQGGWGPLRDAVRRDLEQATQALSFAERLATMLDGQRRLFVDFPRVMEEMRSGAIERVATALSRLYEGGPGVLDLSRFLRDLPLALAHLAAGDAQARKEAGPGSAPPPPSDHSSGEGAASASPTSSAPPGPEGAAQAPAEAASSAADSPSGASADSPPPPAEPAVAAAAPASQNGAQAHEGGPSAANGAPGSGPPPAAAAGSSPAGDAAPSGTAPISPRVELRAKLLLAAPQLVRAAQSYRRNAATVRRATAPRRSPGPWRSDKEVLEQARRAIEFARQIFDAYAEAWADEPLQRNAFEATAAESDRFLAWTQLARYMEVARAQPAAAPPEPRADSAGEERQHEEAQPSRGAPLSDAAGSSAS